MRLKMQFNTIESVKKFCDECNKYDFDIDAVEGNYTVNAKSILGLFSLDLSKVLTINIYQLNTENVKKFVKNCNEWIVD